MKSLHSKCSVTNQMTENYNLEINILREWKKMLYIAWIIILNMLKNFVKVLQYDNNKKDFKILD